MGFLTTKNKRSTIHPIMKTRLDIKYLHGMKIIRLKSEIEQFISEMGGCSQDGFCYLYRARKVRRKIDKNTNQVLCRGHWVVWLYKVPLDIILYHKQLNTSFSIIIK